MYCVSRCPRCYLGRGRCRHKSPLEPEDGVPHESRGKADNNRRGTGSLGSRSLCVRQLVAVLQQVVIAGGHSLQGPLLLRSYKNRFENLFIRFLHYCSVFPELLLLLLGHVQPVNPDGPGPRVLFSVVYIGLQLFHVLLQPLQPLDLGLEGGDLRGQPLHELGLGLQLLQDGLVGGGQLIQVVQGDWYIWHYERSVDPIYDFAWKILIHSKVLVSSSVPEQRISSTAVQKHSSTAIQLLHSGVSNSSSLDSTRNPWLTGGII